jgi:hypothetical protein
MQRYAAPLTHLVLGMDVGALLHQVPDSVHVAIHSCKMERRVSKLRTSQSGRREVHATLCSPAHAPCSWPRCWRPPPPGTGQRPRGHSKLQNGAASIHPAHKPASQEATMRSAMQPRSRTLSLASTLALFSTRYRTASTWPLAAACWSGVYPNCAQASQAGGKYMRRYAAPLTHVVRGLDVGALLHQVPDSVHVAIPSCIMERRPSILRTSQPVKRQQCAALCSPAHARSWPRCWRPSPPGTGQRPRGLPELQDGAACIHPAHKPVRLVAPESTSPYTQDALCPWPRCLRPCK